MAADRFGIVAWSTASGALLGIFAGVALLAVGVLLEALLRALLSGQAADALERAGARLLPAALILCLGVVPLVGAVLGFLEGRLKLR